MRHLRYTTPMDSEDTFPEYVAVTDQEVFVGDMTQGERDFAYRFLDECVSRYKAHGKPRMVIGIAGPSGAGKSLLSTLATELAKSRSDAPRIATLSTDAFHFPSSYLQSVKTSDGTLTDVKGRFDTYDTQLLSAELARFRKGGEVRLPVYSRKIHDPIPNALLIAEKEVLLIVEGLWLLSSYAGWPSVADEIDFMFFLDDSPDRLKKHTVKRHIAGGRSKSDAKQFYERSDLHNTKLVLETKKRADAFISWSL